MAAPATQTHVARAQAADFFISYTSADAAKAEWIAYTLREAGFCVPLSKLELGQINIPNWINEPTTGKIRSFD